MSIAGVSTNECPVSYITEESLAYLEIWERSRVLGDRGVPLYGTDLSQWPIWAVDVVTLLTLEHQRTDEVLERALKARR